MPRLTPEIEKEIRDFNSKYHLTASWIDILLNEVDALRAELLAQRECEHQERTLRIIAYHTRRNTLEKLEKVVEAARKLMHCGVLDEIQIEQRREALTHSLKELDEKCLD